MPKSATGKYIPSRSLERRFGRFNPPKGKYKSKARRGSTIDMTLTDLKVGDVIHIIYRPTQYASTVEHLRATVSIVQSQAITFVSSQVGETDMLNPITVPIKQITQLYIREHTT